MDKITLAIGKKQRFTSSWSSANKNVATVDDRGTVTAVGRGTTEVYCTVNGVSAALVIEVVEDPRPMKPVEPPAAETDV